MALTRDEAEDRSRALTVTGYRVDLDLTRGSRVFGSRSAIDVVASRAVRTFVDVRPEALHSVRLDGVALRVDACRDGRYPLDLAAGEHLLEVESDMAYSNDGEGLHRSIDPADGQAYVYAMSFLDAAPRIFACFDQPDLKAPYRVTVLAPPGWTVLGNAPARRTAPGRWSLESAAPLATYFVTVVAGPYHSATSEHDGIPLGMHVKSSLGQFLDEQAAEMFEVTAQAFDAFHSLFGIRYPFGEYHQCFVPEFNAGAMENAGCITLREQLVFRAAVPEGERSTRALVLVHELAHQWFGDLVTMRWWDDLWLNESFAEYLAHHVTTAATRFRDCWLDFSHTRKTWGLRADQRRSTHPVAGNGAADTAAALQDFDGISYAKGAAALRQLHVRLGDDVFFGGLRAHLSGHAHGNASLQDLLRAWEGAGAVDLDRWAEGWLRTAGVDTLQVVGGTLLRTAPADRPAERAHTVIAACYAVDGEVAEHQVTVGATPVALPWGTGPGALVVPDAHDLTWAKVRLDDRALQLLPARLPGLPATTRAALWLAVRDTLADAALAPLDAVTLLAAALPHEDGDVAIGSLAAWATADLWGRYLGGDPGARDRLAEALASRLATAPAGSSLQLAAARALVAITGDSDLLASWLGGRAPVGLAVDVELRWAVLRQLCRLGAVEGSRVDAEAARDRTTEGRLHALRCRTSLPEPAAKDAAWRALTTDAGLSNHEVYALCEGFWYPDQMTVTSDFVERYFTDVPATAELRSGWLVAETARVAFPRYAVSAGTLRRADELLADPGLPAGIRRQVDDCRSDLARALAVVGAGSSGAASR